MTHTVRELRNGDAVVVHDDGREVHIRRGQGWPIAKRSRVRPPTRPEEPDPLPPVDEFMRRNGV